MHLIVAIITAYSYNCIDCASPDREVGLMSRIVLAPPDLSLLIHSFKLLWPSHLSRTALNTGQFQTSAPNFLYVQAKTRIGPKFADGKKNPGHSRPQSRHAGYPRARDLRKGIPCEYRRAACSHREARRGCLGDIPEQP